MLATSAVLQLAAALKTTFDENHIFHHIHVVILCAITHHDWNNQLASQLRLSAFVLQSSSENFKFEKMRPKIGLALFIAYTALQTGLIHLISSNRRREREQILKMSSPFTAVSTVSLLLQRTREQWVKICSRDWWENSKCKILLMLPCFFSLHIQYMTRLRPWQHR